MKNLLIGFILGIALVLSLGTAPRNSDSGYQSTLVNEVGTSNYLYAVVDTRTGITRLTVINAGSSGYLVSRTAILDRNGRGEW